MLCLSLFFVVLGLIVLFIVIFFLYQRKKKNWFRKIRIDAQSRIIIKRNSWRFAFCKKIRTSGMVRLSYSADLVYVFPHVPLCFFRPSGHARSELACRIVCSCCWWNGYVSPGAGRYRCPPFAGFTGIAVVRIDTRTRACLLQPSCILRKHW